MFRWERAGSHFTRLLCQVIPLVARIFWLFKCTVRSQEQLRADLNHLVGGAKTGFALAIPEHVSRLGMSRESLLGGGHLTLPGQFQQAVQGFVQQLREFSKLLDWEKEHEEAQEESQKRLEELRKNAKLREEAVKSEIAKTEKELEDVKKQEQRSQEKRRESEKLEEELREARRRRDEAERQQREAQERAEAERRRTSWSFSARGDPIICPENTDGDIAEEFCVEYKGPATVTCFDHRGKLQSLDFVGVCDEDGNNCQSPEATWVGEQWRFDVASRQFLYRNVAGQKVADVSCSSNWTLS